MHIQDVEAVKSILNSVTSENIVQSTENLMYLIQTIEILEKTIYLIFDEVFYMLLKVKTF